MTVQVKFIIRLKNPNNIFRQTAETFRVIKSTVWFILKKEKCTGQLSNTKMPERPRKATKGHNVRVISKV